jgi:hypothetical protein
MQQIDKTHHPISRNQNFRHISAATDAEIGYTAKGETRTGAAHPAQLFGCAAVHHICATTIETILSSANMQIKTI